MDSVPKPCEVTAEEGRATEDGAGTPKGETMAKGVML